MIFFKLSLIVSHNIVIQNLQWKNMGHHARLEHIIGSIQFTLRFAGTIEETIKFLFYDTGTRLEKTLTKNFLQVHDLENRILCPQKGGLKG